MSKPRVSVFASRKEGGAPFVSAIRPVVLDGGASADNDVRIKIANVSKQYRRNTGAPVPAVDDVSLEVVSGEFVVLLGPSGCGKTTLLRCVAGLERPDRGEITLNGHLVSDPARSRFVPPERRYLSMVFQSYALWPHMTALENVAFPLTSAGTRGARAKEEASRILEVLGLGPLANQYPSQMSGGQQQRIALARALAPGSGVVLFDEPLSNVDAKVRQELRLEITRMQREIKFSALYVTHDQNEALEMAHKIAIMREGRIVQVGTPEEIYSHPANPYVGDFVGSANMFRGTVVPSTKGTVVQTDLGEVTAAGPQKHQPGDRVVVMFRPEACQVSATPLPASQPNVWAGGIRVAMFAGSHIEYVVTSSTGVDLLAWRMGRSDRRLREQEDVWASVDPADVLVMEDS